MQNSYEMNKKLYYYVKNFILSTDLENKTTIELFNDLHIPASIPVSDEECDTVIRLLENKNLILMKQYLKQKSA